MAVSSYVKNLFLAADASRNTNTAYPLVEGACWFRGIVYYVSGSPNVGLPKKQTIELHNGDDVDNLMMELPCGSGLTMAQFMLPDEAYMDFDDGIWFSSEKTVIVDKVYFSVFYSQ